MAGDGLVGRIVDANKSFKSTFWLMKVQEVGRKFLKLPDV